MAAKNNHRGRREPRNLNGVLIRVTRFLLERDRIMLSFMLVQHFASIGAVLRVRTTPKQRGVNLTIRREGEESWFELRVSRLAKGSLQVIETDPRRQRLILACGERNPRFWLVRHTAEGWRISQLAAPKLSA